MNQMEIEQSGYKGLKVWQMSIDLVEQVYAITKEFPRHEIYGLTSQIRRAAISVPSNIAEGSSRRNKKEFQQFLFIAISSLSELDTQLIIGKKLSYVHETSYGELSERINKLRAMILNLIKSLNLSRDTWNVVRDTEGIYETQEESNR